VAFGVATSAEVTTVTLRTRGAEFGAEESTNLLAQVVGTYAADG
jgi:hypothetical protein